MTRRRMLSMLGPAVVWTCGGLSCLVAGGCSGSSSVVDGGPANKENPRYKELHPEEFPVKNKKRAARGRKGG